MSILRQKFVWIGTAVVLAVLMIFGLAMMGSVLGAKAKSLPVALVVLDRPVDVPGGGQLALGETVKEKITGIAQLPVKWEAMSTEEDAKAALDRQDVYGALVIPADFSAGVASIQSAEPKPAVVKLYVNEGMNSQAATAVKTMLGQVAKNMGGELSRMVLEQLGQRTQQVPIGTAQALLAPFQTEEIVVHPVGANNGNGGAPNMLAQITWMGSLVGSIFLFLAASAARRAGRPWSVASTQVLLGLALAAVVSGFTVWMANSWYGMELQDSGAVWLFLWLAASAFFLMQTALLNWIGFPAMGLLVLLLFFSMPLLNLPSEFMPQATQDWLYSWTPFRYAASGLRSLMYFGGEEGMSLPYGVLWWIAGIGAAVALASAVRKTRGSEGDQAAAGTKVAAADAH